MAEQTSSGEHRKVSLYGGEIDVCDTCVNSLGCNITWEQAHPSIEQEARAVRLDHLLGVYRVGSRDWSWHDEYDDLIHRPVTQQLLAAVKRDGITEPILLGTDGRVWDGHHRITVAMHLGLDTVPVEFAGASRPASPIDARSVMDHLFAGLCPDAVDGWDQRDPECAACRALGTPASPVTRETVTEEMVERAARAYWLASMTDLEGDLPNYDWEASEREQYMWAARIVLEAALGAEKGDES